MESPAASIRDYETRATKRVRETCEAIFLSEETVAKFQKKLEERAARLQAFETQVVTPAKKMPEALMAEIHSFQKKTVPDTSNQPIKVADRIAFFEKMSKSVPETPAKPVQEKPRLVPETPKKPVSARHAALLEGLATPRENLRNLRFVF